MNIEYSLRGLLNALFRHLIKIIAISSVVVLVGLSYIFSIEETYEANATLLVKFGEGALPDVDRSAPSEFSVNDRQELLQSYIKMVKSRDLLLSAVEKIGVDTLYPPKDEGADVVEPSVPVDPVRVAVRRLLGGDLKVTRVGKGNILEFRVKNENPRIAAKFVQILIDRFIEHQNKIYSVEDASFLHLQVESAEEALFEVKQKFLAFKQGLIVSDLQRELDLLLVEKSNLSSLAFSAVTSSQKELEDLLAQEAEMLVTYQPSSPLLKSVQDRIEVVQEIIADKQNDLVSGDESGTLAPRLAKIEARIAVLEENRPKYEQFEQDVRSKISDYEYYKRKGDDARINDMLRKQNITRISVLEHPMVPDKPVSARKKLLLLGFICFGGFLGLGVSLIVELFDDRIITVEAVISSTDVPLLVCFDRKERGGVS